MTNQSLILAEQIIDDLCNWRHKEGIPEGQALTASQRNQLIGFTYDCITLIFEQFPERCDYITDMSAVQLLNNADFKFALKKAAGSKEIADIITYGHYSRTNGEWVRTSDYGYGNYRSLTYYIAEHIKETLETPYVFTPMKIQLREFFQRNFRRFFRKQSKTKGKE